MARRLFLGLCLGFTAVFVLAACSSPAAPAPTAAPKQQEPAARTSEPSGGLATAAPTVAKQAETPAKAPVFPEKGKTISVIVGANAGGPNDVAARLLAPLMEKELGITIQVLNKPGAGWQVGLTELAKSKPDGYTIGYAPLPQAICVYLDPDRKAAFGRKDLQPLAMHVVDPGVIAVRSDSPYKTLKDLIDAAKANPEKIRVSTTGILSDDHLAILMLEKLAGIKFASVHFDGGAPALSALLGGHIDADFGNAGEFLPQAKSGEVRLLGVMDKEESKYFPGVKTMEAQGYKLYSSSSRSIAMPAGAPKEIVDSLSTAIRKATENEEHRKKLDEMGFPLKYMDTPTVTAYWDEMEAQVKPLIAEAKR